MSGQSTPPKQKTDESNDSYIARHEACFEDLLQKDHEVSLKEIQSYVLIRHSSLSSEEKKHIIVDSNGILKYETTREAIRLLGSRFFQDLQGASRGKLKTYDVHSVEEDHDTSSDNHNAKGDGVFVNEEIDEESVFASLMQQGDEDAIFVSEFEDQIIEASLHIKRQGPDCVNVPGIGVLASEASYERKRVWEEGFIQRKPGCRTGSSNSRRADREFDLSFVWQTGPLEERMPRTSSSWK